MTQSYKIKRILYLRTVMKKLFCLTILLLTSLQFLKAQTSIQAPNLSVPSLVAPGYFGPNAFPVPDMSDGTTSADVRLELYGDGFTSTKGYSIKEDLTLDVFAKATIPLFSDRVNLVLWMPIVEYFESGPRVNEARRITDPDRWISGIDSGDAYVSTDILVLDERKSGVGLVLRSVLKSASGNSFGTARVYDAPGYFFDVTAGRDVYASADGNTKLRIAMTGGFLCWQTDNGRQNDAVMYGLSAALQSGPVKVRTDYGGYVGWEGYGDRPMTFKTRLSYAIGDISIEMMHQVGFKDWPYHQFRFGISKIFHQK